MAAAAAEPGEACVLCKRRFAPAVLASHFQQCFEGYSPVKRRRQDAAGGTAPSSHPAWPKAHLLLPGLGPSRSAGIQVAQGALAYLGLDALCALDAASRTWRAVVTPRWRALLDRAWAFVAARAAGGAAACGCFSPGRLPGWLLPCDGAGAGADADGGGAKRAVLRLGALLALQTCTVVVVTLCGSAIRIQLSMPRRHAPQRRFPGVLFYATVRDIEVAVYDAEGLLVDQQNLMTAYGGKSLYHEFAPLVACGFAATTKLGLSLHQSNRVAAHARRPASYAQLHPLVDDQPAQAARSGRVVRCIPEERMLCDTAVLGPVLALSYFRASTV